MAMQKHNLCKRITALGTVALLITSVVALAGCNSGAGEKHYEIASYQGQLEQGQERADYNKELFYRNDKKTGSMDPFILDNTDVDGCYYLYGTEGSIFCYRSQNLVEWEPIGNALDNLDYADGGKLTETRRVTYEQLWAPEVVYDSQEQRYYMFLSCTPQKQELKAGKGVKAGNGYELLIVAVSQYPDRGFQLVNFKDANSCGQDNLHNFNTKAGVSDGNGGYVDAYPHYFAKYLMFDPAEYKAFSEANGGYRGEEYGGYEGGIDPHPYVAPNGDKYLFWVDSTGSDRICGVKMINWLKPDWSTATALTYHTFYTVEDWQTAQNGGVVDRVSYELEGVRINEGPTVVEHNGKYYLTFSVNSYSDSSYQVAQAVSDNVLGPYRKLTEAEGGILISGSTSGSQEISGTGHHCFITAGEQTFIAYHRHDDFVLAGAMRNHAIDEIKWITVQDKFGNDLDVMYANGPTCTVQPVPEAFAAYRNITAEAKISGGEGLEYLSDGLLSVYKYANPDFVQHIPETVIKETTTFTFDFDTARTVRAVMVYNSKMEDTGFKGIAKMEFICQENGQTVTRYIENVVFSDECFMSNDYDGSVYYVTPGAAAYAEFDELNVSSVKITIEVPEGQESVGISEVRILGK